MSAAQSIADRIAQTRRRQAQTLHGAGQAPSRPERGVETVVRGPDAANDTGAVAASPEHSGLFNELCALLPGATRLYGYGDEDIAYIKEAVRADRAGAVSELHLIVRQWRIDIVAAGLDEPGLIGRGVAERARIQFRREVMRESLDENGHSYSATALDWAPEPPEWLPMAPSQEQPKAAPDKPWKRRKP